MATAPGASLKILHILRAPVGGLFRHVLDLARAQAERGHRVGLIADSTRGGAQAEAALAELAPLLALGISRSPISRTIGARDLTALLHVTNRVNALSPDVIHGHGAKGGAYARLAPARGAIRAYTPHGGSLLFEPSTPAGFVYLALERVLMWNTDLFLFESAYIRELFRRKVGEPGARSRVVHNGATPADFLPVAPAAEATDVVFVGELRAAKAVDMLIAAIKLLAEAGQRITATLVGDGADRAALEAQARAVGLADAVRFVGAKPARLAFGLGRVLVIPSRAESLPYIVLEAAAAGVPLIATNVGGIPEIFGPDAGALVPPGDAEALAHAIGDAVADRGLQQTALAPLRARLQARVRASFTVETMTDAVLAAYGEALAARCDVIAGLDPGPDLAMHGLRKKMDAQVKSAFTRVRRRAMPAHDD